MNRDQIQAEAYKAWLDGGMIGTIVLGTGLGKTRLGAMAVKNLHPSSTLVVTSRVNLIEQWKEEMDYPGIDYMCINSAYKVSGKYDLLIVDECHRSTSESYRSIYKNIQYNKLMCLTATLTEQAAAVLGSIAPTVYTKGLDEVRGNTKVVAPFEVYNYVVDMDQKTGFKYKKFNDMFMEATIKLSKMKGSDFSSIYDLARHYSGLKEPAELVKYSKQYWSSMSMRRNVLHHNLSKIKVAHDIINALGPHRKWLVICKSIEYAKMLNVVLGGLIYHSGMKKREKEVTLQKFRSEGYRILVAVDALNEGLNVPEADSALIVSGDSVEHVAQQQLGRVSRAKEGKSAILINLTTVGTVEEKWVVKKTIKYKPKWINNVAGIAVP